MHQTLCTSSLAYTSSLLSLGACSPRLVSILLYKREKLETVVLNLFLKVTLLTLMSLRILTMVLFLNSEILVARLYAFKLQGSMPDLTL